jgi:phenylacetate-coenzyme A ligase PaaK-like adenylate-forming protein
MAFEHYIFGEFVEKDEPLSREDLDFIFFQSRKALGKLHACPAGGIIDLLDAMGRAWSRPDYWARKRAVEIMPDLVGYSPRMVELALDAICETMKKENLERKVRMELGGRDFLDNWTFHPQHLAYLKAESLGTVLHVSAGNVFIGGIDSLVHGILTKNVNLLKISSADPVFPLLFARTVKEIEADGPVSRSFSVVSFKGGQTEIEDQLKKECDAVVVWGGEEAVKAWRQNLPMGTRLVEYGPKYSFSVFTREGFRTASLEEICHRAALDVVMWEQRACSSPQVFYVEVKEGEPSIETFIYGLQGAFSDLAREIPRGKIPMDEEIEILRARELARIAEVYDEGSVLCSRGGTAWTVIYERSPAFKFSPLNRVVFVKPFKSWADILGSIVEMGPYLQTASILASPSELKTLSKALVRCGVNRITEVGKMFEGKSGSPHDGAYQLQNLIRWALIESVQERFDLGERLDPGEAGPSKTERLIGLLHFASGHSPFYHDRLAELSVKSLGDFARVPLLDRTDIYNNTPPENENLLTAPLEKAYVFASGGSTGAPKFSYYSYAEWDEVTTILSGIYQMAGITEHDTVGNLFMAGNMWTSFIVANEALEKIGCVTLPIAGNADIDLIMRYIRIFRPDALIGLPNILLKIAEMVEKERPGEIVIQKILYGGEHMSAEAGAYLRRVLKTETIISAGYASVDGGPIGYQCQRCTGGVHHLLYDYQFLEVLNPETHEPVSDGAPGELIITNLKRRLMPIIRYRTGDMGRMLEGRCQCGRRTPLFELLGRCDDVLRVGTVSIYPDDIEGALVPFPEVSHIFQVVAEPLGAKDRLLVRAELKDLNKPIDRREPLEEKIRAEILRRDEELAEALREGWLGDLAVELVPSGTIPRIRRTGKIRKAVDLRREAACQAPSPPRAIERS